MALTNRGLKQISWATKTAHDGRRFANPRNKKVAWRLGAWSFKRRAEVAPLDPGEADALLAGDGAIRGRLAVVMRRQGRSAPFAGLSAIGPDGVVMRSEGAERRDFFTASRDGRPAGLSVEPDVFHAPAVEDAVGRDRQPFDIGLPTGCAAPVEDDRPGGAPRARDITEAQAETILNKVLDAGINYIDTSIDYGLSEERIGRDISHRSGPILF
jgi:hypothetical protein